MRLDLTILTSAYMHASQPASGELEAGSLCAALAVTYEATLPVLEEALLLAAEQLQQV